MPDAPGRDNRGVTDSREGERAVGKDTTSRMLLGVGASLVLGFCCAIVAALYPGLQPIWTAHGAVAAMRVVHHRGAWEIGNWMFAVGIGLTLGGLVVLTRMLGRGSIGSDLPAVARALATAGTAVWIADLTYRLTATVRVADAIKRHAPVPGWYNDLTAWADDGLLAAAAVLFGAALFLLGVCLAASGPLPRWTGWFSCVAGALLIGQVAVSGDVVPAIIYLAPVPAGVAALIAGLRPARLSH
jgi:hypothetical protein